ncbi:hypothetical protein [Deinococcus sp. AJ005]|uniref:hypothetical protein n=1 Tax=Deinococcus sp. AJ005 TaxID=2652443 RepID=UPI00125CCACB|nr:hypothetical protein [Deinococcus sp. AJ005]QFP78585.1 hypothetical protein DAAJ005_18615 [Deinococcus sp. AJ005]
MTLTPDLETYAEKMRQRRRVAAHNLRAARRLQRQGDQEAAQRIENHLDAKCRYGDLYPNPDRRADLLGHLDSLKATLADLESQNSLPEVSVTAAGQAIFETFKKAVVLYAALAQAARF